MLIPATTMRYDRGRGSLDRHATRSTGSSIHFSSRCTELLVRVRQAGGAKNSRAMPSGSRKLRPEP